MRTQLDDLFVRSKESSRKLLRIASVNAVWICTLYIMVEMMDKCEGFTARLRLP